MEVRFDEDEGFADILYEEKVSSMLLTDVAIIEMKYVSESINSLVDRNVEK